MTHKLPSRMILRRPRGIPTIETKRQHTVAARVYADAIMGMMYVPVGFCEESGLHLKQCTGESYAHGMSEGLSVLYAPKDACVVAVVEVSNTIFVPHHLTQWLTHRA